MPDEYSGDAHLLSARISWRALSSDATSIASSSTFLQPSPVEQVHVRVIIFGLASKWHKPDRQWRGLRCPPQLHRDIGQHVQIVVTMA